MVEYESKDNTLTCKFPNGVPSAGEIIHAILDAPIEYGDDFFERKKKNRKKALCLKDDFIVIEVDGIGKNALNTVIESEELQSNGFKYIEHNDKMVRFQVPQVAVSEQARIMR